MQGFILLLQQALTQNAPASSVSQCMFVTSLRYKKRVGTQIILQNRKTKGTESAPRERMREGMSNARRLLNRRPGRERNRESESGSERVAVNVFK